MTTMYTQIKQACKYVRIPLVRRRFECLLRGVKRGNVTLVCAELGVSRRSYYRWLERLKEAGFHASALEDRSRRPHYSPRKLRGALVERILAHRRQFHYGADRIADELELEGLTVSGHGVYNVLRRARMPFRKRRDQPRPRHRRRYALDHPGQGIQLDIKYVPFPIDGRQAYVFNAIDDCSRWRFQWAYREKGIEQAVDFLQRLIQATPFRIERIQTDNDIAFTYEYHRGPADEDPSTHPFPAFLAAKEIHHRRIPPGQKELNGKVERSHKTDDLEFYPKLPHWIGWRLFQRELARWTWEYNHLRRHSSLNRKTPTQVLSEHGVRLTTASAGTWPESQRPSHYAFIMEKLRTYRTSHPRDPLIHWRFKPKGPQTRTNPRWQKDTPPAISNLCQMSGISTPSWPRRRCIFEKQAVLFDAAMRQVSLG